MLKRAMQTRFAWKIVFTFGESVDNIHSVTHVVEILTTPKLSSRRSLVNFIA